MISGRTGGWPRRFTDAGHLALDAVVAFVDDELPPGPARRAAAHVDHCLSCAAEVAALRLKRSPCQLRSAAARRLSAALLARSPSVSA